MDKLFTLRAAGAPRSLATLWDFRGRVGRFSLPFVNFNGIKCGNVARNAYFCMQYECT